WKTGTLDLGPNEIKDFLLTGSELCGHGYAVFLYSLDFAVFVEEDQGVRDKPLRKERGVQEKSRRDVQTLIGKVDPPVKLRPAPPQRLRLPPHRLALFLDVDGTLAPITARPEFTRVPLDTRRALHAVQRSGAAVAAVSGRPLPQVRRLLLPLEVPAAGSHGAQIRFTAGRSIRVSRRVPYGLLDA